MTRRNPNQNIELKESERKSMKCNNNRAYKTKWRLSQRKNLL